MQNYIFTSDIFKGSRYEKGHPLDMDRVWPSVELLKLTGWVNDNQIIKNGAASIEELILYHDKDYVEALQEAEINQYLPDIYKKKYNIGVGNNPIFKEVFSRPASSAKASIKAIEMLANNDAKRILNFSGGTHHGRKSEAYGFCFLNDCVLAILKAIELGFSNILYVDIDAHHCDGVQDVFVEHENVTVVSIHEKDRWPKTGLVEDCKTHNIMCFPVPEGFNDDEISIIIKNAILPLGNSIKPDLLIIQAGADMLDGDPQSRLSLTNNGYWKTISDLLTICNTSLTLGGGGYNPYLTAKAWAGNWALLNNHIEWLDDEMSLSCQNLLKNLKWDNSRVRDGIPDHWLKSWRDPVSKFIVRDEVLFLLDEVLKIKKI